MLDASTPRSHPAIHNRLRAVMLHVPWYTIDGQCRLALDCGVACSTISRLVRNQTSPTYYLARAVTVVLARRLGVPLDLREVFSTDGTYPTPCVCDLTPDCKGCFPPEAYTADDDMMPEYQRLKPGDWCTYPALNPPPAKTNQPLSVISHR